MMGFYLAGAALVLLCLGLLLPGLLKPRRVESVDMAAENVAVARDRLAVIEAGDTERDGAEFDSPEIQAALLEDLAGPDYRLDNNLTRGRWAALGLLLVAPLLAAAIYTQLGDDRWLDPPAPQAAQGQMHTAGDIQQLLLRLEQNLEENPDNADGWAIAGRTYMVMNDFAKAENAYRRVHELVGDDPDILTAWADATLMLNGWRYTPEIADRISRALALDPVQVNALWIGAMGAKRVGDSATASAYAGRLRPLLADNPQALEQLDAQMNAAEPRELEEATGGEPQVAENVADQAATTTGPARIEVALSMEPSLVEGLNPASTVFVFAQALQGPPMPLAAKKLTLGDLPQTLVLDDSSAMVAGMNLSSQERVKVTARISLSGSPGAQPGDPTSETVEIATRGADPVSLEINRLTD